MNARLAALVLAAAAGLLAGCAKRDSGSNRVVARPGIDDVSYAGRAYAGDAKRGEQVFATNCATCHGTGGRPGGVGPSLIGENERQDLPRTIVWIQNPNPPMPKLYPSPLSDEDVADVAAFVQTIK